MDADEYTGFDEGLSYLCGLSDLSPRAMRYMMRPHQYTSPEFWKYYNETVEMLKKIMGTRNDLILMVGAPRCAMDAAFTSVVEPGDKILLVANGYWGRYPAQMVELYGGKPIMLKEPIERAVDPKHVDKKLKEEKGIKAVSVMHVETEIGIRNPIDEIGEVVKKYGALYIVDSATAFPGNPLEVDKWGIDMDYFASHKGMNAPSGLSPISVSKETWEAIDKRKTPPKSWYSSLTTWRDIWLRCPPGSRHCVESFPTPILHVFRAKLDYMFEIGYAKWLKKAELAAKALRAGCRAMGLKVVPPEEYASNTDFGLEFPVGVGGLEFGELMEEKYRITVHHHSFADAETIYFKAEKAMRVGTIADYQHIPRNIFAFLTCTGLAMKELGAKNINIAKGIEAADEYIEKMYKLGIPYYRRD